MAAYSSSTGLRDANEVLEGAIRANRRLGAVCLGLAITLAVAGVVGVVVGAIRGSWMTALSAVVLGGLFLPLLLYAVRSRATNVILRALEAPLGMNDPDTEIAKVLNGFLAGNMPVLGETTWLIKPKHTFRSVVTELADGLANGTISINKTRPDG